MSGLQVSSGGIRGVILDVSGVMIVDSYLARVLTEIAADCTLLGAGTVVAGIQPAVAITLVEMGLRLDGARMARSLEAALAMFDDPGLGVCRRAAGAFDVYDGGTGTVVLARIGPAAAPVIRPSARVLAPRSAASFPPSPARTRAATAGLPGGTRALRGAGRERGSGHQPVRLRPGWSHPSGQVPDAPRAPEEWTLSRWRVTRVGAAQACAEVAVSLTRLGAAAETGLTL